MAAKTADYLIIGAGLTGSVVAHRLANAGFSVVVFEAGKDPAGNPNVTTPLGGFSCIGTEIDWAYSTIPQKTTYDRVHTIHTGKALGGGSTINYGGWLRGDANDHEVWARAVGDQRWSYQSMLPWLRKTESFHDPSASKTLHGFDGPIRVTSVWASDPDRRYPLREPLKQAWMELGVHANEQHDKDDVSGLKEFHENSKNGERQPSHLAYSLAHPKIDVLTDALVARVVFTGQKASGVELADGRKFAANKEVILAAGAARTPQLLLISGIGSSALLSKYGIPLVHDLPMVGQNLHSHYALFMAFKLKHPERALALEKFKHPAFFKGVPQDWVVCELEKPIAVQDAIKKEALSDPFAETLQEFPRPLVENMIMYTQAGLPGIPGDGSHIATSDMILTPTSRGSVSISSASITDPPVIDSNYIATEVDRAGLVHAGCRTLQLMLTTPALREYVECDSPLSAGPGTNSNPALTADATDAEILHRIKLTGSEHHHTGGTAAMGKVVDAEGKVFGVSGLRVVDASVMPAPIAGHMQAVLYAMSEQLASMIIASA